MTNDYYMWMIVGLGNPGKKYSRSRHNIGFMVVEEIAKRYGIEFKEENGEYRIGKGLIDSEEVLLLEPLLYMNRSGIAVKDAMNKFNIPLENLVVVHDDIDMMTGKLRIKRRGSSGGHRGVESIIQSISSKDLVRLKIGIGREEGISEEDYVLRRFRRDEIVLVKKAIERASDAVISILLDGLDKAMNTFNKNYQ